MVEELDTVLPDLGLEPGVVVGAWVGLDKTKLPINEFDCMGYNHRFWTGVELLLISMTPVARDVELTLHLTVTVLLVDDNIIGVGDWPPIRIELESIDPSNIPTTSEKVSVTSISSPLMLKRYYMKIN